MFIDLFPAEKTEVGPANDFISLLVPFIKLGKLDSWIKGHIGKNALYTFGFYNNRALSHVEGTSHPHTKFTNC